MDFRAVCVVNGSKSSPPDGVVVGWESRGVFAQQGVFIKPVGDIDTEPGSTTIEPVLDNSLEFLVDRLVSPVEVGLRR